VFYYVKEMRKNNTFLAWSGTAAVPIPQDVREHTVIIQDTRNFNSSWIVRGQTHDWMNLDNVEGTVIERGLYRIDGPGDDQNNAGIQLSLLVPLRYFDEQ
jgi:hypothetical protein